MGFVQVTLKKECYKKNAHVAFSYKGYEKNEDTSVDHKWVVHAYRKCPLACLTNFPSIWIGAVPQAGGHSALQ